MSYPPPYHNTSYGRGYAPPPQGPPNPYYSQGGRGHAEPSYHMSPPNSGYVPEYNDNMRGGPGPHGEPMGYGYQHQHPQNVPPQTSRHGSANMPPHPTSMRSGGSGSGFESGSNQDEPRQRTTNPKSEFANDCEIVVLHKAATQYAEMIERQLKDNGLKVDIMYPKSDVKLVEFLKPISKLGTIFAIIIDEENERARSIHFYQFRGQIKPQYNKNVPLVLAYDVLTKKYNELKQKEIGVVPDTLKTVLSKLTQEQILLDNEYVMLVRFLQERRKRQNAFLNRTSNVIQEQNANVSSMIETQEGKELKQRILSILNQPLATNTSDSTKKL